MSGIVTHASLFEVMTACAARPRPLRVPHLIKDR
jgi:hypothetical protein